MGTLSWHTRLLCQGLRGGLEAASFLRLDQHSLSQAGQSPAASCMQAWSEGLALAP